MDTLSELETWLHQKPRQVSVVVAARSALRAVPVLSNVGALHKEGMGEAGRTLVLPVFRALAVAWTAGAYSSHTTPSEKLREAAKAAYRAVDAIHMVAADAERKTVFGEKFIIPEYHSVSGVLDAAAGATFAAASSAAGSASFGTQAAQAASMAMRTDPTGVGRRVGQKAVSVARDVAVRLAVDAPGSKAGRVRAMMQEEATAKDREMIDKGLSATELAFLPIWPDKVPNWVETRWAELKRLLMDADENWEVWTEWYEARLKGRKANQEMELARALTDSEVWQLGPRIANSSIKQSIKMHSNRRKKRSSAKETEALATVPEQSPASLQPIWEQGRLTLPQRPATADIGEASFAAALLTLGSQVREFVEAIDDEQNIDRRFISFIEAVAERIPSEQSTQAELFRLGHQEEVLKRYGKTVDEQWPDFLASRYHALLSQFDLTMRQSVVWREFKYHGTKHHLSPGQLAAAGVAAMHVAKVLREPDAAELVDPVIPQSLEQLAQAAPVEASGDPNQLPGDPIRGGELVALDLMESLNNIFKRIASATLLAKLPGSPLRKAGAKYAAGLGRGFVKEATEQGPKDGQKLFRLLRSVVVGGLATAGSGFGLVQLISMYPGIFGWLRPLIKLVF
jgi:hypothetical protein